LYKIAVTLFEETWKVCLQAAGFELGTEDNAEIGECKSTSALATFVIVIAPSFYPYPLFKVHATQDSNFLIF